MRRQGRARFLAAVLVILTATGLIAPSPSAQAPDGSEFQAVSYAAPSHGVVIDPFRPPLHVGAPGNRGLEYGGSFIMSVFAAAPGRVEFAGGVGGRGVITLRHADGVKTTYTGLSETIVGEGDFVAGLQFMGTAQQGFHFGALVNEHYLDPQVLIDAGELIERARLIPIDG